MEYCINDCESLCYAQTGASHAVCDLSPIPVLLCNERTFALNIPCSHYLFVEEARIIDGSIQTKSISFTELVATYSRIQRNENKRMQIELAHSAHRPMARYVMVMTFQIS
jgi:hypothetical protein